MANINPPAQKPSIFLLVSADAPLLSRARPAFTHAGAIIEVALTADAALASLAATPPPDAVLIDAAIPIEPFNQFLASIRAANGNLPILLIAEKIAHPQVNQARAGAIDDLVLRSAEPEYWRMRAEALLRTQHLESQLETLRESIARHALHDRLTGVLHREAMLNALFRETDRVQRGSSAALAIILFDIDDFGHWNARLGANVCDELLCQVALRSAKLLRSYDLLGRMGNDEFLIGLPGCTTANASTLAERLRAEVFAEPYHVAGESIRLSACFGIACSLGRSPVIVLREAEQAMSIARQIGPETIKFGRLTEQPPPVTFLSPTSGEESLVW